MIAVTGHLSGFLAEPRVATLTTLRADGSPHVVAVRFTWDQGSGLARVLTVAGSRKARNLVAVPGGRAALCQVDGFRWVTLEGPANVHGDQERVERAARHYTERYSGPPPNPAERVVIEIAVDRITRLNV
ncbi:pyridoxamine 5'-phosphate oxidase family protein [Nonomuraea sp. NPDC050556]|uniref:pyridoxamine 5'-phosphate oxidase family protein n=1 Tax=Nonomuraea sp. NPDC050556 TaxID=3364369 RepID=UPI0037920DFF